jgi:hypothetical protein
MMTRNATAAMIHLEKYTRKARGPLIVPPVSREARGEPAPSNLIPFPDDRKRTRTVHRPNTALRFIVALLIIVPLAVLCAIIGPAYYHH